MDSLNTILILITIATLCESVWETLKMVWQNGKFSIDKIGILFTGVIIAFTANVNIFEILNVPNIIPYVGVFLTGILISRGSSFVHDLISNLSVK